eukprot:760642-Hanusia_phi.AAC.5
MTARWARGGPAQCQTGRGGPGVPRRVTVTEPARGAAQCRRRNFLPARPGVCGLQPRRPLTVTEY